MSRKTQEQLLVEAIQKLTKAVMLNTQTLAQAMGKSSKDIENLAKQLQDSEQHRIPADAGPEEIVNRMAGRLTPGIDPALLRGAAQDASDYSEGVPAQAGRETTIPLADVGSRPLFSGLLQNAADNARAERDRQVKERNATEGTGEEGN